MPRKKFSPLKNTPIARNSGYKNTSTGMLISQARKITQTNSATRSTLASNGVFQAKCKPIHRSSDEQSPDPPSGCPHADWPPHSALPCHCRRPWPSLPDARRGLAASADDRHAAPTKPLHTLGPPRRIVARHDSTIGNKQVRTATGRNNDQSADVAGAVYRLSAGMNRNKKE